MTKIIRATIDVEITKLKVKKDSYSFDFKIYNDGILVDVGVYKAEYFERVGLDMKRLLEDGYAVYLALRTFTKDVYQYED